MPGAQRNPTRTQASLQRTTNSRGVSRRQLVLRFQSQLGDTHLRLAMTLLVVLTGGFGWLMSMLLLRFGGITDMAIRYPLAVLLAWGFFLALLWLWLRHQLDVDKVDGGDVADGVLNVLDATDGVGGLRLPSTGLGMRGGSGMAGGMPQAGGLSAQGISSSAAADSALGDIDADGPSSGFGLSMPDFSDADELAIPLALIALVILLLLASFYLIYLAPVLLAELLADAALSYGLYRSLRGQPLQSWWQTAARRTAWPFALTAIGLAALGWGMQAVVPGATNLAQVWAAW